MTGTALLTHTDLLLADRNYEKAALAASLLYVNDSMPGIVRLRKGKHFQYKLKNKTIQEEKLLTRIRKLAIPPAWTSVWICTSENGHIQATGLDLRQRKQYRYHPAWTQFRGETKFHRLFEFGKQLPALRERLDADLRRPVPDQQKVLATVISLMQHTYIRIGNSSYEKLYGSYGLTTMKDKHVDVSGDRIRFSFRGKKGIQHDVSLKSSRLARAVKTCRDIPGKELFQYYDTEGNRRVIESGMVNGYIQSATGKDFTAKDFRTWAGSLHALEALNGFPVTEIVTERKKNINQMLDIVSGHLGNTRAVCRKYYVHPALVRMYEEGDFARFLNPEAAAEIHVGETGLTETEKLLMKLLRSQ